MFAGVKSPALVCHCARSFNRSLAEASGTASAAANAAGQVATSPALDTQPSPASASSKAWQVLALPAREAVASSGARWFQQARQWTTASGMEWLRYTKEVVVSTVKWSDAHLRNLERRIALHEERLVQSHASGDTSGVVQNTDTLRQLYMEHKGKLDDMLFFWIFGGAVCVGGWVRAAWVYNQRASSDRDAEAGFRAALAETVRDAVSDSLVSAAVPAGRTSPATDVGQASEAAPAGQVAGEPGVQEPAGPVAAVAAVDGFRDAEALRQEVLELARMQRATLVVAVVGCTMSAVSLLATLLPRK